MIFITTLYLLERMLLQEDIFPFKHPKPAFNHMFPILKFRLPSDISPVVNPIFDVNAADNTVDPPYANVINNLASFAKAPYNATDNYASSA